MDTVTVRLNPGKRLRDPDSKLPVGPEPMTVRRTGFWLRRIADGSVAVVEAAAAEPKPLKNSKKSEG